MVAKSHARPKLTVLPGGRIDLGPEFTDDWIVDFRDMLRLYKPIKEPLTPEVQELVQQRMNEIGSKIRTSFHNVRQTYRGKGGDVVSDDIIFCHLPQNTVAEFTLGFTGKIGDLYEYSRLLAIKEDDFEPLASLPEDTQKDIVTAIYEDAVKLFAQMRSWCTDVSATHMGRSSPIVSYSGKDFAQAVVELAYQHVLIQGQSIMGLGKGVQAADFFLGHAKAKIDAAKDAPKKDPDHPVHGPRQPRRRVQIVPNIPGQGKNITERTGELEDVSLVREPLGLRLGRRDNSQPPGA